MRLTPDHVAKIRRPDDHAPAPAGLVPATDAEQHATIAELLTGAPPSGEIWVFAYGSLIWNTDFEYAETRTAVVRGWHRSFCLGWDVWFRGNPERPGLMLSMDRGGQAKGVAFRLPPDAIEANMMRLLKRELAYRPMHHMPRWVSLTTSEGPLRAITFVINRNGGRYVSGLSDEEIAAALATASGHRGSMAEYLHNTVVHLEASGIRDRHLWRLQEMVAERIEAAHDAAKR